MIEPIYKKMATVCFVLAFGFLMPIPALADDDASQEADVQLAAQETNVPLEMHADVEDEKSEINGEEADKESDFYSADVLAVDTSRKDDTVTTSDEADADGLSSAELKTVREVSEDGEAASPMQATDVTSVSSEKTGVNPSTESSPDVVPTTDGDPEVTLQTGWEVVDDKTYYRDDSGEYLTGFQSIDGHTYYFEPSTGVAASEWNIIDGSTYYFDPKTLRAVRYRNWLVGTDSQKHLYYFDGLGRMRTGWITWADGTKSYYDSSTGAAASEWKKVDGHTYYFDPSTLRSARWSKLIHGKTFYFNAAGHMHTGWLIWATDKSRSFYGKDGAAVSGWKAGYYIDPTTLHTVRWSKVIDGSLYYFNGSYKMYTGWLKWPGGMRSYFDPSTGVAVSGWQNLGGATYYFDSKTLRAVRYRNWLVGTDSQKHLYYFDGLGRMRIGWITWADGAQSYFAQNANQVPRGAALSGWFETGKKTYYSIPSTLKIAKYAQTLVGKDGKKHLYYFGGTGAMRTGWLTWGSDRSRSYFGADGAAISGWKKDGGAGYYIDPTSFHSVRGLHTIQGENYFFDTTTTIMVTNNWVNLGNGAAGWAQSSGVVTKNSSLKYDENGILRGTKSGWFSANSNKYYINEDLSLAFKWLALNGFWYYLDPNKGGAMVSNATMTIDGYKRVFGSKGTCSKVGYQNPSKYYQVSSWTVAKSCSSGIFSYVTPSMISADATRADCVEAFVNRAYDYLDTPYVWDYACAPGVGVDCSGLVTQCLYAAGIETPYTPYAHYYDPWQDHNAENMRTDSKFQKISFSSRRRGDLVFYSGHVAIYLGNDRIIHALSPSQGVIISSVYSPGAITGCSRVFV